MELEKKKEERCFGILFNILKTRLHSLAKILILFNCEWQSQLAVLSALCRRIELVYCHSIS